MIFGHASFASISFASTDTDLSTLPAFVDFLGNQDWDRSYLFHATPYDPVGAAEVDVRASLNLPRPILDSVHWPAILKAGGDIKVDMFSDDEGGQGRTSYGNIELLIGDAEHDEFIGYNWDGRFVEVRLGRPDLAFDDYVPIATGTVEDVTFDRRRLSLVFRGKESRLDVPVSPDSYAGTGGVEGPGELEGQRKPKAFGTVLNITPVLVDETNLIYQWHDGLVKEVTRAMDGGAELLFDTDVVNITTTDAPLPGRYKTHNSGGYIRLGAPVAKILTLDGKGDATGAVYVDRAADIAKRMILEFTDLTEADLDLASFYRTAKDNRTPCGLYTFDDTVESAVTALMESIGAAWSFTLEGLLHCVQFRFRRAAGAIDENDIVRDSFKRSRTLPPSWERRIKYNRNSTVMSDDQFVGVALESRKTFSKFEWREWVDADASIKTAHAAARSVTQETMLMEGIGAISEAVRRRLLFGEDRDRIDVTCRNQQFKYRAGQTLTLTYPRFSIDRDFIIMSVREGTTSRQTTFELWG